VQFFQDIETCSSQEFVTKMARKCSLNKNTTRQQFSVASVSVLRSYKAHEQEHYTV